jgi:hypothetical protein
MTDYAFSGGRLFWVRLMALQAPGNIPMPCMVTREAIELRVLRNVCLHLLVYLGVAYVTASFQSTVGRDIPGCVGFGVTFGTLYHIGAVNLLVTAFAFRKNIFVFHSSGAIHVELHMALLAVNSVFASIGFDEVINVGMTATTVPWFKGSNTSSIHCHNIFFNSRFRRRWCYTPGKNEAQGKFTTN